jgi:hypothetical protein
LSPYQIFTGKCNTGGVAEVVSRGEDVDSKRNVKPIATRVIKKTEHQKTKKAFFTKKE